MKYYLYISDTKVDMILPQVPHETKRKIATQLGFDFKILKAGRKAEQETEENRITRLESVLSFIREFGNVGTVDNPDQFIEDSAPMMQGGPFTSSMTPARSTIRFLPSPVRRAT